MTTARQPPADKFRSSLLRLMGIAKRLRTGTPFTAVSLADEYAVDPRTIKRDIELLRTLEWRIDWHVPSHSYSLTHAPKPVLL